jgi:hypothetical protein
MEPKRNPRSEEEMEQYGRITVDRLSRKRGINLDNLTASIVRIMIAVGLGAVGIVFVGIIIIGG